MTLIREIENYQKLLQSGSSYIQKNKLQIYDQEDIPLAVIFGHCWLIKGNSILEIDTIFFLEDRLLLHSVSKKEILKKYVVTIRNMNKNDIKFLNKPEQFFTGREITSHSSEEIIKFLNVFAKNGFVWYVRSR